jgi:uncharacterized membrane protein
MFISFASEFTRFTSAIFRKFSTNRYNQTPNMTKPDPAMTLLIAGVVFWTVVHLVPAAAPGVRAKLATRLGQGPYKGLFALNILLALALIVFGWKAATPTAVYAPPLYGTPVPAILLLLAFIFLIAASAPNNLKRIVRHPQMTAVIFWSAGHLLSNGDSRSLVLFGGFAIWAVLEVIFINKRDGQWQKPAAVPWAKDIITVVVAVAAFAGLVYFHASLFGASPVPT